MAMIGPQSCRIVKIDDAGNSAGACVAVSLPRGNTLLLGNLSALDAVLHGLLPDGLAQLLNSIRIAGTDNLIRLDAGASLAPDALLRIPGNRCRVYLAPGAAIAGTVQILLMGQDHILQLGGSAVVTGAQHLYCRGTRNVLLIGAGAVVKGPGEWSFAGHDNRLEIAELTTPPQPPAAGKRPAAALLDRSTLVCMGHGNQFLLEAGCTLDQGTTIRCCGSGNLLYTGAGTYFLGSAAVSFEGSAALCYICGAVDRFFNVKMRLMTGNIVFYGFHNHVNESPLPLQLRCLENAHILIGSDCMFSYNILIRNGNGFHAIYDAHTRQRISRAEHIIIGDHVWIGHEACILQGTHIGDGAVVGARTVTARHALPARCVAGVPARVIRDEVLWSKQGPEAVDPQQLHAYDTYQAPAYTYQSVGYKLLQRMANIAPDLSAQEKYTKIKELLTASAPARPPDPGAD